MLIRILALVFSLPAMASPKFNLPIEVICNGKPVQAIGGYMCAQAEPPSSLKVKIPPTKGQLRVTDCNEDLTADRNPDDFNTQIEKQGWWIFSRTVRILSNTPTFSIPSKSYNDCGITVSVAAEDSGVQTADVVFESRLDGNFANITCGGETFRVVKAGTCRPLSGGDIAVSTPETQGALLVIGTTCGVSARLELPAERPLIVKVPVERCVIDLAHVGPEKAARSRLLVLPLSREDQEIDNPLMVRDGAKRRIYKPIGANIIATEIYSGDRILWRSGVRNQDSYHIDPSADGGPWPTGAIACHTAYSRALQSMSGSCYNLDSDKEVPYFFK